MDVSFSVKILPVAFLCPLLGAGQERASMRQQKHVLCKSEQELVGPDCQGPELPLEAWGAGKSEQELVGPDRQGPELPLEAWGAIRLWSVPDWTPGGAVKDELGECDFPPSSRDDTGFARALGGGQPRESGGPSPLPRHDLLGTSCVCCDPGTTYSDTERQASLSLSPLVLVCEMSTVETCISRMWTHGQALFRSSWLYLLKSVPLLLHWTQACWCLGPVSRSPEPASRVLPKGRGYCREEQSGDAVETGDLG
ncbi:hypothetical protein CB1_001171007 [Camelus ferus]|nr:hypothetical protein CB1_001171007 [Camelus ferus]